VWAIPGVVSLLGTEVIDSCVTSHHIVNPRGKIVNPREKEGMAYDKIQIRATLGDTRC
jgi:hypothetical protein